MGSMSEGLVRARQLVAQLDFPAAQQVLRDQLTRSQQDSALAEPEEAETAALYAGVLLQLSEPHTARTWATYAHNAMRRLHGERDRRTLHALGVLAVSEHRAGALDRATLYYQQLITALSTVDGPDGDRTLAARADASFVEHARGSCASSRTLLAEVITVHQQRHGMAHPVGIRMMVRLAAMWRDCGNFDRAHQVLAHARAQAVALPPQ
ncbi:MAG TPA: tetratricopeptide repeat protein, partial [Micromonosporaceae bacterium]|nr:tetratricopeptide repeat protein [Micromonosporaceae bacterium]